MNKTVSGGLGGSQMIVATEGRLNPMVVSHARQELPTNATNRGQQVVTQAGATSDRNGSEVNKSVPLFANPQSRQRAGTREKLASITIDDADFYYGLNGEKAKESIVEQNMYDILKQNNKAMKAKCLEAKLPIMKKSIYAKDYVEQPFDIPIRGDANTFESFKPIVPIDTETIHRVRGSG